MEHEDIKKGQTRDSRKSLRKFRKYFYIVLGVSAIVLVSLGTLNILDPVIEGRRVSLWAFDFYYKNDPQAISIIRNLNEDGLKFLLNAGLKQDPPWVTYRRHLPGLLHEYIPEKVDHSARIQMIYNKIILHSDFFEPHAEQLAIWLTSDDPEARIQSISLLRYFPKAAESLKEEVYHEFSSDPECFRGGLTLLKSINYPPENLIKVIEVRLNDPDYRIRSRAVQAGFELGMSISDLIGPMESVIRKGPFDAVSEVLGIAIKMGPDAQPLKGSIEEFLPTISDMSSVPAGLAENALRTVMPENPSGNNL